MSWRNPCRDLRFGVTLVLFFPIAFLVVTVRTGLPERLLVVASLGFYGSWNVRCVALLAGSTLVNYIVGQLIATRPRSGRVWLACGVAGNLLTLGFFKYVGFLGDNLAVALDAPQSQWLRHIVLPVGISFFSFEGIAYLVEVRHGTIRPRKGLWDFDLFMSFFPHLAAGPIIRPDHFFPRSRATGR